TLGATAVDYPRVSLEFFSSETVYIWGSQLDEASAATIYGYTTGWLMPYYFWIRPYYNGTAWVDDWCELTEMRAGKITGWGGGASVQFGISSDAAYPGTYGIDGTNDYYNRWHILKYDNNAIGGQIIDYVTSTGYTFWSSTYGFIVNTQPVILTKTPAFLYDGPYYSWASGNPTENVVISVLGEVVRVSISPDCTPVYIKFFDVSEIFAGATAGGALAKLYYNEFVLTARELDNYGSDNFVSLSNAQSAGGSLTLLSTYRIWIIGVFDNFQRVALGYSDVTLTGANTRITPTMRIHPLHFTSRLTSVRLYVQSGIILDPSITYFLQEFFLNVVTWTGGGQVYYTKDGTNIDSLPTTENTLLEDLVWVPTLESIPRYSIETYLNGRSYIAGTTNPNYMRFSSIRGIVSEPDVFPFSESEGYGYIVVGEEPNNKIVGIVPVGGIDLLILKERSAHVYDISSYPHRLSEIFRGIGASTTKCIVYNNDYGVFWYDANDVYWYGGGTEPPRRISSGKLRQYIRKVLYQYLPYSFATFNRKTAEYWIFTQISGTPGAGTVADHCVLRYSPEYDNWNILRFPSKPAVINEDSDGDIEYLPALIATSGYIREWGYGRTTNLATASFKTHKLPLSSPYQDKMLKEIGMEYEFTGANSSLQIFINDEVSQRLNYAFPTTKTNDRRGSRQGINFRKIAIQGTKPVGSTIFRIKEIAINYSQRKYRVGRTW
ncbi:hypothetical protein KKF61_08500, partial [Patescibacteria group bacterium]|nr:hypothetical protein [Patescibacteria group bacterium]